LVTTDLKQRLFQAFLTALLLFGAVPLSYGNVDYTRQLNVLSVHDSSYDKLTNESKGLLSSYKQVDETRTSRAIASHLKAKHVNVSADTMTMIGSSIEADAARITAQVLNLASDKNRTFERHFKDTSGLILRTIADKGHIRETAAPSTIAAERLIFNGRTLGGASDHAGGDHHTSDREHQGDNHHALITALSSEHNLNEAQINQIKAVLNSEEWNRETTTLSQTGSLIVQAVVTSLTSGAGSTVTGALMQGMSEAAQAAVSAAVNSIASQVTSQLVTAALTGESPRLDVGSIALNAVKSAVIAGVDLKMDAMIKQAKLGELGTSVATAVGHAGSSTAVYGGRFEDALKANLISAASAQGFEFIGHNLYENPKYKGMNLPPKAVVHGLVGGVMAQISGGDFKSGVIATATAHVIGEDLIGPRYADRVIHGEMSSSDAKQQIDAIASAVAGAVTVMANGGEMSGKDLSASMAVAHSVVENNYLKGFDAYVEFGRGVIAGGKEKAWEDLKAAGLALASPRQTVEAIGALLSSPEAMKGVAKETYEKIKKQYLNVANALYSVDKAYQGDAANQAGKDLGKLMVMMAEAGGLGLAAKGAGKAATGARASIIATKARDLIAGGKKAYAEKPQYVYDARADRYRDTSTGKFVAARNLPWPENAGFASSTKQRVKSGTILDRYGSETGRFLGEPGTTVSQRGMAQGAEGLPYTQYRVVKPFDAQVGPAAPVPSFGASGGATQFLPGKTVKQLVDEGFLERVK